MVSQEILANVANSNVANKIAWLDLGAFLIYLLPCLPEGPISRGVVLKQKREGDAEAMNNLSAGALAPGQYQQSDHTLHRWQHSLFSLT